MDVTILIVPKITWKSSNQSITQYFVMSNINWNSKDCLKTLNHAVISCYYFSLWVLPCWSDITESQLGEVRALEKASHYYFQVMLVMFNHIQFNRLIRSEHSSRFSSRMFCFFDSFIFHSILTNLPDSAAAGNHPHTMVLPPKSWN